MELRNAKSDFNAKRYTPDTTKQHINKLGNFKEINSKNVDTVKESNSWMQDGYLNNNHVF